jgi:DNA-binding transcriptional regulator YiaG
VDKAETLPHNTKLMSLLVMRRDGIESWAKQYPTIQKRYFEGKIVIGSGPKIPKTSDRVSLECYTSISMGKIETTLKEEITRLSRKELRAAVTPLAKEVRQLRRRVVQLENTVAVLDREAAKRRKADARAKGALSVPEEEVKAARISAEWVQNLRMRLNVSQEELAKLSGVSVSAVRSWEYGISLPRGARREALVALRKLGRRDVKRMLEGMETQD